MYLSSQRPSSLIHYNTFMKILLILLLTIHIFAAEVTLQVLGSGGPEIDGRASASYIIWIDNKARILIDTGSGSMLRFEESGARLEDLELIALTHLHIDHVVDLPSYVKAGYFTRRSAPLPIIGPIANRYFPSTNEYTELMFGEKGAYRYMSDVLTPKSDSFQIVPQSINAPQIVTQKFKSFTLSIINVNHGIIPALAFRVDIGDKSILISGDTSNKNDQLSRLAKDVDLFVAHHAIPETHGTYANNLHMTPSIIGAVANIGDVKKVLLTHRMKRTLNKEEASLKEIQKRYKGPVVFANDMMKIKL